MTKVHIVTLPRLRRAVRTVRRELAELGFWDDAVAEIDVRLVTAGYAYGWMWTGGGGDIEIAKYSVSKLIDRIGLGNGYLPLAMVVRHEYGHAVADTHRRLVETKRFEKAFWAEYSDDTVAEFDPEVYISPYAAWNCQEDFAEVFSFYLKHRGRLPAKYDTETIRAKWKFVKWVAEKISA